MKVHYVFRSERYWPAVLDETESRLVESLLRREGMTLYPKTELTEILGKNGKVTGARLSDGKVIQADLIAYAIGSPPDRPGVRSEAGIACERGNLVNERMETSCPIFTPPETWRRPTTPPFMQARPRQPVDSRPRTKAAPPV